MDGRVPPPVYDLKYANPFMQGNCFYALEFNSVAVHQQDTNEAGII